MCLVPHHFDLLDKLPIGTFLSSRQIISLIFIVYGEKPDVGGFLKIIVNDPQTSPLTLSPSGISPANLPQSSCSDNDLTGFRILDERLLKKPISFVIEIRIQVSGEGRGFDKFHSLNYTLLA